MRGFIRLYRSLLNWEWYKNPVTKSLFIHLLLLANYTDRPYQGIMVLRGQVLTSRETLSKELGYTPSQIRTAMNHLISTNEIAISRKWCGLLITLKNYNIYQTENSKQNIKQPSNVSQTVDKRYTNNKENKENNNNYYIEQKSKNATYDIEQVKKRNKSKKLKYEKKSG
mgnify:CR=1 FL=1